MQSGLLHRSHSTPFHYSILNHPWPSSFSLRLHPLSSRLPSSCTKFPSRTLDSGADGARNQNSRKKQDRDRRWSAKKRNRRWWADDDPSDSEDESAPGLWEEFIDNMWFFKVLGSYGWMLPIIMISWLAASGPKAFLASFSIPFGLSLLTFVFKKLSAWIESYTDYKPKNTTTNMENVTMEEEEEQEIQWNNSKQRTQEQSNSGNSRENGSLISNGAASFGGWEDLVDERELKAKRRARRPRRATNRTPSIPLEDRMNELKTRVEGERELPLLLKLLLAVFPFLSSWTELL